MREGEGDRRGKEGESVRERGRRRYRQRDLERARRDGKSVTEGEREG